MRKNLSSADLSRLPAAEAKVVVNRCWKKIEDAHPAKISSEDSVIPQISESSALQVVRVFVSSTFKDFFSEREILVKQVFPELREWCHKRGISIIDVDLRWGVPPNRSPADTISVCFEELQRCSKRNQGFPFFIGLIGERYGWIPECEDISPEIKDAYHWLKNVSITHMEILHGAFWQPQSNPNASFFFRDPVQGPSGTKDSLPDFLDDNNFSKEHLKELKRRIKDRYPNSCLEYNAEFGGYYDNGQVRLSGLEDFAGKITAMLKSSIEFQLSQRVPDVMDPETRAHWNFVLTEQTQNFVGREDELKLLKNFALGRSAEELRLEKCLRVSPSGSMENGTSISVSQNAKHENSLPVPGSLRERPLLWVSGHSGLGKSSLLAKFVAEMKSDSKVELFFHFEAAAPDSNTERCLLRRILRFINHPFTRNCNDNFTSNENFMKVASKEFGENILSEFNQHMERQKRKTFVIVFDGIDKMLDVLDWLPMNGTPRNVTVIVSGDSGCRQLAYKLGRGNACSLKLKPWSKTEQSTVVEQYFDRYGKHLDSEQTELLLKKDRSPDWLELALEELRVFGVMQKLNAKIEALPDATEDLAWNVISRLIQEDTTEQKYIEKVFRFLACCERGIHESGLLAVLGNSKMRLSNSTPPLLRTHSTISPGRDSFDREELFQSVPFHFDKSVPYIIWAQLLRTMRAFLRSYSDGRIDFSSENYKKVVLNRLLSDGIRTRCHEILAIYHSKSYSNSMSFWEQFSCLSRLTYHLAEAKNARNLLRFFRKDPRAARVHPSLRLEHFTKSTCQAPSTDNNATLCSFCMPRFAQQCILCKSSLHFNKGHSCISISTNAHHSACFNPSPVMLCEEHASTSKKRCLVCGNKDASVTYDAYICCECSGQKTSAESGVSDKCFYFSS